MTLQQTTYVPTRHPLNSFSGTRAKDWTLSVGRARKVSCATQQSMDDSVLAEALMKRLPPALVNLTNDSMLREDLFQEAFIVVLGRVREGAINSVEQASAYAYRTALYLFYRRLNRNRKEFPLTPELQLCQRSTLASPDELYQQQMRTRILTGCINELKVARDREIAQRVFLLDQEKTLVAAAMNLSLRHYDRVMYRIKNRLKALIDDESALYRDLIGF